MTQPFQELKIIKGLPPAAGDTDSAEEGQVTIDLMSAGGLMVKTDGWRPNGLTHTTVDSNSVLVDGIVPLVGKEEAINEIITCFVTADSMAAMAGRLVSLNRVIADCHAFWESTAQIEPVYIKWWAGGAPRAQYALIYRMNLQAVEASRDLTSQFDVTIELFREPFWRPLPPGANPILWHLRDRNDYDLSALSLAQNTDHFHYEVIENRHEWDSADTQETRSKNYIQIAKEDIAGDAPALAYLSFDVEHSAVPSLPSPHNIYINRTTKTKRFTVGSDGFQPTTILNMSDYHATLATPTTDASCGVSSRTDATREHLAYTIAGSTQQNAVITLREYILNLRGSWAALLRCRQATGSAGDVKVRLRFTDGLDQTLEYADMPVMASAVSGCRYKYGLSYLGTFQIPLHQGVSNSPLGTGLDRSYRTQIHIDVDNTNASGRDLIFLDMILLPLDEPNARIVRTTGQVVDRQSFIDNTRYSSHGISEGLAGTIVEALPQIFGTYEIQGNLPTLIPGVDNRLNFLHVWTDDTDVWSEPDSTDNDMVIRLNIIPRWRGVVDV